MEPLKPKDLVLFFIVGLLIGTYAAVGTRFLYGPIIWGIGTVIAFVMFIAFNWFVVKVKALSWFLIFVFSVFLGGLAATYAFIQHP